MAFVSEPATAQRHPFCVFPQLPTGKYRLDFLLAFAPRAAEPGDPLFRLILFVLECDGRHHENQLLQDFRRDADLRKQFHLPTLRVRGHRILGEPEAVTRLISEFFDIIAEAEEARVSWYREEAAELGLDIRDVLERAYEVPEGLTRRFVNAMYPLGCWYDHYPLEEMFVE